MSFRVLENAFVWTPRESRNSDFDSVCSCLWCVCKEAHMSLLPCMWRHRSWMTTKSQNLNISAFPHPSPWGLETPGQTRLHCVFVALCRYAHTLTCIVTTLHLHVWTCICISNVRSHVLWSYGEKQAENLSSCTYLQDPRSGVHYSSWGWVVLQMQMLINLGGHVLWILTGSIVGTTKFQFYGTTGVVPHKFTQFFHTNFYGTTYMFCLRTRHDKHRKYPLIGLWDYDGLNDTFFTDVKGVV